MIGETISHYKVTTELGRGGMGVVYKAEDTKLERPVALKFLAAHAIEDPEHKARFLREAKAAARLDHQNICPIYEIDEVDGQTFLAMAYLEGQTLKDKIAERPLKLDEALDIAIQTAQGLKAAPQKEIVHRDIKPANLMLTEDGPVKIMDFGLAQLTDRSKLTKTATILGTPAYMSPEQARRQPTDRRTDIWSLGVVIYEMVSGRLPFEAEREEAVAYSIVHEEPEPLTAQRVDVPVELDRIVSKAMAKEPGERYQHVDELAVDLRAVQRGLAGPVQWNESAVGGTRTRTREYPAPPTPAAKPRRAMAVLLTAAGLLILLAAAFVTGTRFAAEPTPIPTYKRLTFRRGTVTSARFAPGGNTIVYSAAWDGGRRELFSTRPESSESRSLNIQDADILAISKTGEMALALRPPWHLSASFAAGNQNHPATLLQASLAGGAPREVLRDVLFADWTPDGQLGVARMIEGRTRLESPVGKVLYETPDRIASFRISPRDGRIAFSERPSGFGGAWRIATIDKNGDKTVLAAPASGDNVVLAWSSDADEVWYESGYMGGQTIRAVAPSGAGRVVQRVPVDLRLFDLSEDGRALVNRVNFRSGINCLAPGQTSERELSWFDASEVDDMSPNGKTILFTEFGEGGGLERWGVYLRKTSGEPAVRLGRGQAFALSPEGSMALTMSVEPHPEIVLLPTGAGEPVRIKNDGIRNYEAMDWMPDGRQIVFAGSASGHGVRCYIQDIDGGEPRPITPEGYRFGLAHKAVSPSGEWIAAEADGPPSLFPIEGGEEREIPGVEPRDDFVAWSADGRSIFLMADPEVPASVYRVDLSTGKRSLWKTLAPADTVGVYELWAIQISADEQSYCYT